MASTSQERPRTQVFEMPEEDVERNSFINHPLPLPQPRWAKRSRTSIFNKVMAVVNLALGITLATSIGLIAHETSRSCPNSVAQIIEPYSPVLENVVPVIKKFEPEPIYEMETSDEVEAAWEKLQGPNNGVVVLGAEDFERLSNTGHKSAAPTVEPERHIYGISMYQQLHCLNTIRKSFYRGKFYSNLTDEIFQSQKNDCFDFLRQAIQCHGDVSLTYLSSYSHSTSLARGTRRQADWVGGVDLEAGGTGLSSYWDVEHSCRALDPIEEWVVAHQITEEHQI